MPKLSISNIGSKDFTYDLIKYGSELGIKNFEIAPGNLADKPTNFPFYTSDIIHKLENYKNRFKIQIIALQGIWYGLDDCILGSNEERERLIERTNSALKLAESIECEKIILGGPRNRKLNKELNSSVLKLFFEQIADICEIHKVILCIEPNSNFYGSEFLTDNQSVAQFVYELDSKYIAMNLDTNNMHIEQETILDPRIKNCVKHIHISPPFLKEYQFQKEYLDIMEAFPDNNYDGFYSLECFFENKTEMKNSLRDFKFDFCERN